MSEGVFIQDLAVLLAIAFIFAAVFSRLGWPKVIGYILGGALMGAHTWGGAFLRAPEFIEVIGQLGVVFLMLGMGLSFSRSQMRLVKSVVMPCAIVDTVVMIFLGYTIGVRFFGWSPAESVFLGVAICDSATTLLAKVIDEMQWGKRMFTRYVLGTSIFEDIVCVGAIAVATGFAQGGQMSARALFLSLGGLGVFFLTTLVFGFIFVPRLLDSVGKRNNDEEALLLTLLGVCFFVSYFADKFKFSLALGAFLVGIIASSSVYREKLLTMLEPLKSMFAAVFFVTIGLQVDPTALWANVPQILIVSLVVIVGKFLNNTLTSIAAGVDVKTAVQTGMSLAQIGEFAFMVAVLYAGIVEDNSSPMFQIAVGASLLTTVLNPMMIRYSDKAGDFVERHVPKNLAQWLSNYRSWLAKIRSSSNTPAYLLLRAAAIRLSVYAVLLCSVSVIMAMLSRFDFTPFWPAFERYDRIIFFCLSNLFAIGLLPLVIAASRAFGDEVAEVLAGEGTHRWQTAAQQLIRFIMLVVVVVLYFVEWTLLNIAISPVDTGMLYVALGMTALTAVIGWRFFRKAGRRAISRFQEALTVDERREGLVQTMTIAMPEGIVTRLSLPPDSPAIGSNVVQLNVRAKTGASIVSVYRNGVVTRNIGPEWEFAIGDVLVVLGDGSQVAALKDLLGIVSES